LSVVNKGVLEALIKSGSFDAIHKNRSQLFESIDLIIDLSRKYQQDIESGQGDLFCMDSSRDNSRISTDLPPSPEWKDNIKLNFEKEVLGLYLSGHPLAKFEKEISSFPSYTLSEICEDNCSNDVSVVGIISNVVVKRSQKNGKQYATGLFEDLNGSIEILIFSKVLDKYNALINCGEPVMVTGKVEMEGEKPKKILANSLKSLKEVRRDAASAIHIKLDSLGVDDDVIVKIKEVIEKHKGNCPLFFHVKDHNEIKTIRAHSTFNIFPSEVFIEDISKLVGHDSVRYSFTRYD
jgi:DNA polymerase-3 subunit alpha